MTCNGGLNTTQNATDWATRTGMNSDKPNG